MPNVNHICLLVALFAASSVTIKAEPVSKFLLNPLTDKSIQYDEQNNDAPKKLTKVLCKKCKPILKFLQKRFCPVFLGLILAKIINNIFNTLIGRQASLVQNSDWVEKYIKNQFTLQSMQQKHSIEMLIRRLFFEQSIRDRQQLERRNQATEDLITAVGEILSVAKKASTLILQKG